MGFYFDKNTKFSFSLMFFNIVLSLTSLNLQVYYIKFKAKQFIKKIGKIAIFLDKKKTNIDKEKHEKIILSKEFFSFSVNKYRKKWVLIFSLLDWKHLVKLLNFKVNFTALNKKCTKIITNTIVDLLYIISIPTWSL